MRILFICYLTIASVLCTPSYHDFVRFEYERFHSSPTVANLHALDGMLESCPDEDADKVLEVTSRLRATLDIDFPATGDGGATRKMIDDVLDRNLLDRESAARVAQKCVFHDSSVVGSARQPEDAFNLVKSITGIIYRIVDGMQQGYSSACLHFGSDDGHT